MMTAILSRRRLFRVANASGCVGSTKGEHAVRAGATSSRVAVQSRPDLNRGCQRAVHGTPVRDCEQPAPLLVVQRPLEGDIPLDERKLSRRRFTGGTIFGVDARMAETNR